MAVRKRHVPSVSSTSSTLQLLTAQEWLHAYEEDSSGDEVYRPSTVELPLSRRPRERLRCKADGTAFIAVGGPDDRARKQPATWERDGDAIVIHITDPPSSRSVYRVVSISADRLLVRVS